MTVEKKCLMIWLCFFGTALSCLAQHKIIVAKDGSGHFKTIQGAINSLNDSSNNEHTIFIKNGVYHEKLYIEKSKISLVGEDRELTVISAAIARDEWRCNHADDWGVATMNIGADNVTLKNLTLTNSYGFNWKEDIVIECATDTVTGKKTITKTGHQMALRTMHATKFRAINVRFRSFGGDTVSPWDTENGMWYFKDCIMEGGVDFYCPRGWAWAENCTFITHTGPAAIWHDGSKHEDSKTVLMNCTFTGYDGFMLGRYHRDAQFYLINCEFANNMKDSAIYRVPTTNVIKWGHRVFYYNCKRPGGNYPWFENNISSSAAGAINIASLFKGAWKPELIND
jgi:pectinesterase